MAVVFFVRNQNVTEVLETLRSTVPRHSNYLGTANPSSETGFNFRLHVNGDRNREIKLAVGVPLSPIDLTHRRLGR